MAIDLLSNVCFFPILSSLNGKLDLNASSCIAHAVFTPVNVFDISDDNSSVSLSNSSILYAKIVQKIDASNSLSSPLAIASLNSSASALFCASKLSRFIFPLSAATSLSDSSSFIVLFNSFCDLSSLIGVIKTETFTLPNVYIPLKNSGNVHILGSAETTMVRAYLLVFPTISK